MVRRRKAKMVITPAMKEWCKFLARDGEIKNLMPGHMLYHCHGKHGLTWKMVDKLETAGLIYFEGGIAILTDKGKESCA